VALVYPAVISDEMFDIVIHKSSVLYLSCNQTHRCGHCKSIKPDWDKLIADFEGSATQMVADVDCTAEGEPLCQEFGIQGFPTLKWGDPSDLQDYNGGRSYEDLKQFADMNLK
jgi:thiol-disulfide isomerase/thioredoxin